MALLTQKKCIINSKGEEEFLNIYTTKTEAVDTGKPCKIVKINVDDQIITGYIGCTDELDTAKASSKRVMIDGKEHSERKYMGIKSMNGYMKNTYPDAYQTITEFPEDFPDTSDCTNFNTCFINCYNLDFPLVLDTRNGTNFSTMFWSCSKASRFPSMDVTGAKSLWQLYGGCSNCKIFPELDTKNCTQFTQMYQGCKNAVKVSSIDLLSAKDELLSNIDANLAFTGCSSLRTITFKNVPVGTIESTLRNKFLIPDTVTEIIINFREV